MALSSKRVAALHRARKDQRQHRMAVRIYGDIKEIVDKRAPDDFSPIYRVPGAHLRIEFDPKGRTYFSEGSFRSRSDPSVINLGWRGRGDLSVQAMVGTQAKILIHEITHYLDWRRMENWEQANKNYVGPREDPVGYFNHPIELNAYFHQAVEGVLAAWAKTHEALDPRGSRDPKGDSSHQIAVIELDEFARDSFRNFRSKVRFDSRFWMALTVENKKRMQKRVAALYLKLREQAAEEIKALVAVEDVTALLMAS